MDESQWKMTARWMIGLSFVWVGALHFIDPAFFLAIMPPALPFHLEFVYISGLFEILGGFGLMMRRTKRTAGWGLLALLVAVYPANIHMLINEVYVEGMPREKWLLWARMPLQFVFGIGVSWAAGIWPKSGAVAKDDSGPT